jgi:hypothetical protein
MILFKVVLAISLFLAFTGCQKDDDEFPTEGMHLRKIMPYEGSYEGRTTIYIPEFDNFQLSGYSYTRLSYLDGERLTEYNSLIGQGVLYHYNGFFTTTIYHIYENCGQKPIVITCTGQGHMVGDTLFEKGKASLNLNGKRFTGEWYAKAIKN